MIIGLSACGSNSTETEQKTPESEISKSETLAPSLIGMPVEEAMQKAEENDIRFQIVMQDGQPLPAPRDSRPGRMNATVDNGMVTSIAVE